MAEEFIDLGLPQATVLYYPNFIDKVMAENYHRELEENLTWQQYNIKLFGKEIPQPRLTALYSTQEIPYKYSGLELIPNKFPRLLQEIHDKLKNKIEHSFSHCLANLYRNEIDSMGWHADDEKVLGDQPVIASLSLGADRKFEFKHKKDPRMKLSLQLENGSLLLMQGETQKYWKHQLPKLRKPLESRINLTFRNIEKGI